MSGHSLVPQPTTMFPGSMLPYSMQSLVPTTQASQQQQLQQQQLAMLYAQQCIMAPSMLASPAVGAQQASMLMGPNILHQTQAALPAISHPAMHQLFAQQAGMYWSPPTTLGNVANAKSLAQQLRVTPPLQQPQLAPKAMPVRASPTESTTSSSRKPRSTSCKVRGNTTGAGSHHADSSSASFEAKPTTAGTPISQKRERLRLKSHRYRERRKREAQLTQQKTKALAAMCVDLHNLIVSNLSAFNDDSAKHNPQEPTLQKRLESYMKDQACHVPFHFVQPQFKKIRARASSASKSHLAVEDSCDDEHSQATSPCLNTSQSGAALTVRERSQQTSKRYRENQKAQQQAWVDSMQCFDELRRLQEGILSKADIPFAHITAELATFQPKLADSPPEA
eukprot:m.163427 g.163427  ORF g.163427 m.163427 type:complete len:394 (+) comp14384_c1_seq3:625-1806(+)